MIGAKLAGLLAAALAAVVTAAVAAVGAGDTDRQLGYGQVKFRGLGPERWAQRYREEHARYLALRARVRHLLHADQTVHEAIDLACVTYGYCTILWRRAGCETGGTYSATAHNPSGASGLFQFIPSTWATTPYARFSIWSPYANALAAGWMMSVGRSGEWSCR